jgi:hypothetical protein
MDYLTIYSIALTAAIAVLISLASHSNLYGIGAGLSLLVIMNSITVLGNRIEITIKKCKGKV